MSLWYRHKRKTQMISVAFLSPKDYSLGSNMKIMVPKMAKIRLLHMAQPRKQQTRKAALNASNLLISQWARKNPSGNINWFTSMALPYNFPHKCFSLLLFNVTWLKALHITYI